MSRKEMTHPGVPMTRRDLMATVPCLLAARGAMGRTKEAGNRPRIAAVTTIYRFRSHGQGIVDRFLDGYGWEGRHYRPAVDIVSLYVDQKPRETSSGESEAPSGLEGLSHDRGGPHLRRQTSSPSTGSLLSASTATTREMTRGRRSIRATSSSSRPSTSFAAAAGRCRSSTTSTSRGTGIGPRAWSRRPETMGFPFMAGSSLPVTWRLPAVDVPFGAGVR